LECWLSGQAAGSAAAKLVLGLANPSGKLAETIPVRLEDSSSFLNFPGDSGVVRYGEGIFIGYRGYDRARQEVSYPFGFGLSYTSFTIGDLALRTSGSVADDDLEVQATVTVVNIGAVAGAEVVQVYVCDVESTVARPVRELKAFAKVFLEPGESKQVSLVLDTRAFAYWSTRHHDWVVEAGEFEVALGSSSWHLAARDRVHLEASSVAPPLTGDSTLQEWVADDRGRELLSTLDVPILGDPELVRVIGTMPMRTLASFSGLLFDHGTLDRLEGQLEG
ncbi:MAG: fibronectin type III-like domain-contianing protein, partial [Candidatus Dormibacter sp.]|uniref:fibronectin type III-like domain-contianing protein n=1 Tax=Candidatus Dormibacter sp. TaxID=2973982 RepID=UPI003D9BE0D6